MKKIEYGQGMAEFALTVLIFLVLLVGILEMAWLFYFINAVATASREAARYGAAVGTTDASTYHFNDCAGIRGAAKRIAFIAGLQDSDIIIKIDNGPNDTSPHTYCTTPTDLLNAISVTQGQRISITVTGHYHPLLRFIPIPNMDIQRFAAYTIIKDIAVVP